MSHGPSLADLTALLQHKHLCNIHKCLASFICLLCRGTKEERASERDEQWEAQQAIIKARRDGSWKKVIKHLLNAVVGVFCCCQAQLYTPAVASATSPSRCIVFVSYTAILL